MPGLSVGPIFLRLIIIFLEKGQNATIFLLISKFLQVLDLQPRIGKSFSQSVVEQLFRTKHLKKQLSNRMFFKIFFHKV